MILPLAREGERFLSLRKLAGKPSLVHPVPNYNSVTRYFEQKKTPKFSETAQKLPNMLTF